MLAYRNILVSGDDTRGMSLHPATLQDIYTGVLALGGKTRGDVTGNQQSSKPKAPAPLTPQQAQMAGAWSRFEPKKQNPDTIAWLMAHRVTK